MIDCATSQWDCANIQGRWKLRRDKERFVRFHCISLYSNLFACTSDEKVIRMIILEGITEVSVVH